MSYAVQELMNNATAQEFESINSSIHTHTKPCEPHYLCEGKELLMRLVKAIYMSNGKYQNSFSVPNLALPPHHVTAREGYRVLAIYCLSFGKNI